jgi:hypothetical protein
MPKVNLNFLIEHMTAKSLLLLFIGAFLGSVIAYVVMPTNFLGIIVITLFGAVVTYLLFSK